MKYFELYTKVLESYNGEKENKEKENNYFGYFIYRKLSFLLTPFFLRFSISANSITAFTLIFPLLILCFTFSSMSYIYITIFSILFHIFDYIDGNIARVSGTTSDFGQYLDSLSGNIYWVTLYISIGVLSDKESSLLDNNDNFGFLLSLIICIFDILSKEMRLYCRNNFKRFNWSFVNPISKKGKSNSKIFNKKFIKDCMLGLQLLIPYLLLLSGYFELVTILLIFLLFYFLLIFIYTQMIIATILLKN